MTTPLDRLRASAGFAPLGKPAAPPSAILVTSASPPIATEVKPPVQTTSEPQAVAQIVELVDVKEVPAAFVDRRGAQTPAKQSRLVSIPVIKGDPERELTPYVEFAATLAIIFLGLVMAMVSGQIPGFSQTANPWDHLLMASAVCLAGLTQGFLALRRWQRSKAALLLVDQRAKRRGVTDPLTGLANRAGYKLNVEDALALRVESQPVGIIYIDLDRFKEVNDNYGHDMGDKLLCAVTARLGELAGNKASGARLGGDEFALLVDGCASEADISAIGDDISLRMGQPFVIDGTELVIGGSVGIAIAPTDGSDFNELVRRADISMYRAKAAGRGNCMRFDPSMEDTMRSRKIMEDELRHAIERGEMEMVYQPVFAADGETIRGVEALVRWNNSKLGMVSPADFIPLAEETGLIASIGEWTVRVALGHARDWPDIGIAVNVSPAQFRAAGLAEMLIGMVAEAGLEPKRVEIEITEGVLIRDADRAHTVIKTLREAGMRVALDDFGTGFSSLSYLRRFEFDKLKIDQVFVKTLSSERGGGSGSAAIIHNVVSLGRSLGMTVQAEGVETLEHHIFLRAAGCHCLQGYYFARPMSKTDFDVFYEAKRGFSRDSTYADRLYG